MATANLSSTELELPEICSDNRVIVPMETKDDDDDDNDAHTNIHYEVKKKRQAQCDSRMICVDSPFASQPPAKKIRKDWENDFLPSCSTTYTFNSNENDSVNELHEKANDLEYLINPCGTNLTCLNLRKYPTSQIMPIINANCQHLEKLYLEFEEIMSQDFENCFSNMSHLTELSIKWKCKNSTLPMTLAKSLEQVGETLKTLYLSCTLKGNDIFLPDSLASVLPRLIALNCLEIFGFGLSQLLFQSINKVKNLVDLTLESCWPNNHSMFETRFNMYLIGCLKGLETLHIESDYGVRDDLLINICNNAKKLRDLCISGTNITDIGMSAIDNLEQLTYFDLGLDYSDPSFKKNEFITDESIQRLFNPKLHTLDISNCMKITDEGVIELVENLPNLDTLFIRNTKVTCGALRKISELLKYREKPLGVYLTMDARNWLSPNHHSEI